MQSIVVDSGPLIALFDHSDRYHKRSVAFVRNVQARLITNVPVLTEVVYVLDFSVQAQRDFLLWAQQALSIDTETVADMPAISALLEKYADLPADFADASLVALSNRLKIRDVASIDKDFTIYRTSDKRTFDNHFPFA